MSLCLFSVYFRIRQPLMGVTGDAEGGGMRRVWKGRGDWYSPMISMTAISV